MSTALSHSEISVIEQIKSLPVLPQVTMRITERMQSPTATLQEISSLIQSDVGLTAKILRLANSSYYSIPGGVSEVSKALQYLGFTTIAQIILTTSVFGSFKTQGASYFPLDQFWKHSFAVGLAAEIAARSLQLPIAKDAFIGGLMHDMGKLILLEIKPEQLHTIVKYAKDNQLSFVDAESTLNLTNHAIIGAHLADHWNLPKSIANSIRHHHDFTHSENTATPIRPNHDDVLIAWANQWVHELKVGHSGDYADDHQEIEAELSKKLGINVRQKEQIQKKFETEFEKAGAILSGHT